ncbi:hypothetical protein HJB56_10855 [Rhizobium lentis]|nr:hypothetical protein [Rhizobium lentis]MBX5000025.1 hypothetical protein [Rhizobium lentis]MBX5018386.1 hypothetical protein [Rhizobium lentis]MBX5061215.1 hypothetical protein [Rhizobium lentis]MBX5079485.1 hypothetical protein [Rhizobium lentis]MBX5083255.1 hypothetical protein [Rhizobium lentis]
MRWIPMGRRELDLMLARLGLINEPVTNDPIRFVAILGKISETECLI